MRRSTQRRTRTALAGVAALAVATAVVGQAAAATNSSTALTQLSLNAAPDVLSVTVSPSAGAFASCSGGNSTSVTTLGFPNGTCLARGLVITNTGLPGRIMITGSPLSPVGGGTAWALCGGSDTTTPTCQNAGKPGADQYDLEEFNRAGIPGVFLSAQPQCDLLVQAGRGCQAAPGQRIEELLQLNGPQSTVNGASAYSTTVTWTAVP